MEIIYEDWFKILCWSEPIALSAYICQISLLYTFRCSLYLPTWQISCHSNRSLILGKSISKEQIENTALTMFCFKSSSKIWKADVL